ncbi:MAG: hypothetical protein ACMUEL_06900 [Flavobacteriales bacterium Tduv]
MEAIAHNLYRSTGLEQQYIVVATNKYDSRGLKLLISKLGGLYPREV